MRIAVTGATGFIGRHVVARLARERVTIVCVGRDRGRWSGIGTFVEMAIEDAQDDAFERLGRPDAVVHLAWNGLPNYRSLHHFETELPHQYTFLKKLFDGGLTRLTGVGTCFEYGMQDGALDEGMDALPTNPYGFAKNALRQQLEHLNASGGGELTWARLFYVWGEDQAAGSLYPSLCSAVSRGEAVFDMSHGEQLRDYMHVEAVADCIVRLALEAPGAGVVNICSGRPVSVRRLVECWIAENNWKIRLNLGERPYPDYEPLAFWGDRKKMNRCLAQPRTVT